jgi:sulfite reductase (NADPH) flavoprotein alpha-component
MSLSGSNKTENSSGASAYSRLNPFPAILVENRLLSRVGSSKEVRHIVFELNGSSLNYRVGQSLGVYATNCADEVNALLKAASFTGDEPVTLPKAEAPVSLRQALTKDLFLGGPTKKILEAFLSATIDETEKQKLQELLKIEGPENLNNEEKLKSFLSERFFVDLFQEFPSAKISAQTLVDCMKKLNPRLYSIASSPKVAGTKVDLTVAIVRYQTNGRARKGVCSSFLADRIKVGEKAPVFVAESPFKLTDDDNAPIIMIGPGTGIAPFRAFLQERQSRNAKGKNWLFFGDRNRSSDFLYEEELLLFQKSGLLTRLSLAWSRDQENKFYVQDLMKQNAEEIWNWLQQGAYFYVCGDAKKMAKDVDAVLHEIISTHGKLDEIQTSEYIGNLKKSSRYMKDVY